MARGLVKLPTLTWMKFADLLRVTQINPVKEGAMRTCIAHISNEEDLLFGLNAHANIFANRFCGHH